MQAALRLFAALAASAVAALAQPAGLAGHYEGTLRGPQGEIQVSVDLDRGSGQAWIGHMSLNPGPTELPLENIRVSGDKVSWTVPSLPGTPSFDGSWNQENATLSLDLRMGERTARAELKRTRDAKVVTPEPNSILAPAFAGNWEGSLDTGQQTLRIQLLIEPDSEGRAKGVLTSVDQGGVKLPVNSVRISGNELTFEVRSIGGKYAGRLNEAKNQLSGDWTQAGNTFPLILRQAAK